MTSRRSEFLAGVRAELPILLGVLPFGVIYGVTAIKVGLSPILAQAMSAIIFAGSAQFVTVQLVAAGTPGIILVLAGLVVNLRHMLYSASVAPYLRHVSRRWKWLLAYLLTDEAYVVTILHFQHEEGLHPTSEASAETQTQTQTQAQERPVHHWFMFGAGLALWTCWQLSTAVGVFLGGQVPSDWPLDFALPLTFIALLVPALRDRAGWVAAGTAGLAALLAAALPLKLGLIAAALAGVLAGMLVPL